MVYVVVTGARPQFIKMAPIVHEFQKRGLLIKHIHTGQHYDKSMSDTIFEDLDLPPPDYNLNVGSGLHGEQTGKMLAQIERILMDLSPECVVVPGDTNSTLAGALAAVKLKIPVVHIEAGLRSNDWNMPEEINRMLVDRVSDLLITYTDSGKMNLISEGQDEARILVTGDPMVDALEYTKEKAQTENYLEGIPDEYILVTLHRSENVDIKERLEVVLDIFRESPIHLVFPMHPRTEKRMREFELWDEYTSLANVTHLEPVGYLQMVNLLQKSKGVMTDSGGLQKEAFILKRPCVTLRTTTEWVESLEAGANRLLGFNREAVIEALQSILEGSFRVETSHPYGDGQSSVQIVSAIASGGWRSLSRFKS